MLKRFSVSKMGIVLVRDGGALTASEMRICDDGKGKFQAAIWEGNLFSRAGRAAALWGKSGDVGQTHVRRVVEN